MRHKHERRNTQEHIQELQQLGQYSISPAHKILGLSKNEKNRYPKSHVENHIRSLYVGEHDADEDVESPIPSFHASDFYELKKIPISSINQEEAPSKHLVRKYKAMHQDGSDFPPVVLSKLNNEIMDGRHRVQAAKELGHKDIYAYTPLQDESSAHKILGLSKNEEEEPAPEAEQKPKKSALMKEREKVKNAMTDLREDRPNVKGMFSRIYSIPSQFRSKVAKDSGQVPRSLNVYGSHYPVARILDDNKTLVLHTSDYGTDGKTQELIQKIKQEVPDIFPDYKVLELHHPDYRHSAKAMRIKSEKNLADYFKHASEKHPNEEYRKHALEAHEHLTKIKKAEYGKPIHQKRIEHEGWDGKQNEQKRVGRISEYLQKVGLTPDLHSDEGRKMGATLPSSVSINPEGDPHDQQLIHEAAHAMLTPVGQTLPEYQDFIGKPGLEGKLKATAFRKEMQEVHGGGLPEQTAQHLEAGIARRSGVEPFRSPKRGVSPTSSEEKARRHAHKQLQLLDEGIHAFDPFTGEKQYGDSMNALINARARGDKELLKPVQEKVRSRLKQQKDFNAEDFLAVSEKQYVGIGSSLKKAAIDLAKGSLQRKYPFDPNKDVAYEDASKIAYWQEGDGDREAVPSIARIDQNARFRALNKLHSRTEVRRHPKTGERMFLLHRGVSNAEHIPSSTQRSSWTPHKEIAETFTVDDAGKVFSAWIPESQIHNVPTQLGSLSSGDSDGKNYFADEHEVIVKPHDFLYAKKQKLPKKEALNAKINEDFSGRYVKKQPKTEEQKQKSIAQNPLHPSKFDDKLAANENQKPNLKKTLTAGTPVGAPSSLTGGEALQTTSLSSKLEQPFKPIPEKVQKKKKKKNYTQKGIKSNNTDIGIKKAEFDESWFFEDDASLVKNDLSDKEDVPHPEKPWVTKRHPNGTMMWHSHPEHAKRIDAAINSKQAHAKILNSLQEPHKSAYIEHIRGVIKDPNRHFIPTEEGGVQKLRARHVKSLIDGKGHVTIDTSHPDKLIFNRESHSQGKYAGTSPQITVPIKKDKV